MIRCHPVTFDLRPAFAAAPGVTAFAPGDEDTGSPSPAADDAVVVGGDDAAGEGDGSDDLNNPRIKKLSDEAGKHRRLRKEAIARAEAAEARVAELEGSRASEELQAENRTLHLRLAWERATAGKFKDTDAAWKLADDDLAAVTMNDAGEVDLERLGEIIVHVAERHPYLVAVDKPANETPSSPWPDGGSDTGKPPARKMGQGVDKATLTKRYPALRGRI